MMPAIRPKAKPVIEPVDNGDAAEDGLAEGEDEVPPTGVAVAPLSPLAEVSAKTCGA